FGGGAAVVLLGQVVGNGSLQDKGYIGIDGIGGYACAAQPNFLLDRKDANDLTGIVSLQQFHQNKAAHPVEGFAFEQASHLPIAALEGDHVAGLDAVGATGVDHQAVDLGYPVAVAAALKVSGFLQNDARDSLFSNTHALAG